LLAGLLVIGSDIAALAEVGAGLADDDLAVEGARRPGDELMRGGWHGLSGPQQRAGLTVERKEPAVERGGKDPPVGISNTPVRREILGQHVGIVLPDFRIVLPQLLAGPGVYCIDGGMRAREIEHAPHRDRGSFQRRLSGQVE